MANKRYYVDPDTESPLYSREEISRWNKYLKNHYKLWIYFSRIAAYQVSDRRIRRYSARTILQRIRKQHGQKASDHVAKFLAFMWNQKNKSVDFKFNKKRNDTIKETDSE